jgi:hypothetical protein
MGRPDQPTPYSGHRAIPDHPHKFSLRRVRICSQGYDSGGAYWGTGAQLWFAEAGAVERFFRAGTRELAKRHLREEFPNAAFYR